MAGSTATTSSSSTRSSTTARRRQRRPEHLLRRVQPALSFGKIFDQKLEFGPIKDVLLAMTYEFGEGDTESYLIGPGFDLAIPGFDYFQLNFYQRHTEGSRPGDNVWQITPVWSYTIPVGARTS
jgi:nucleoside-specific outer membrane channel protein Tsx